MCKENQTPVAEGKSGLRPRVVVVGGSSGIGLATAQRFAHEGWRVCIASNALDQLEAAQGTLHGTGHIGIYVDVCDASGCASLAERVRENFDKVTAIVNAAGISENHRLIESEYRAWDRQLRVILYGSVNIMRAMVPCIEDGGRIIQITSIHHERVAAGSSSYGMAKAAITQMVRSLAVELAPRGILANAIAPGFVNTPMSIKQDGTDELASQWYQENYVRGSHLPLRRAASPQEIAGVAWFLAGSDASYMTGSVVTVDGGLTITF
jgi:3-oxoacyl-[acyl-carrier protein] reductase